MHRFYFGFRYLTPFGELIRAARPNCMLPEPNFSHKRKTAFGNCARRAERLKLGLKADAKFTHAQTTKPERNYEGPHLRTINSFIF